jgi:hypothetical protein
MNQTGPTLPIHGYPLSGFELSQLSSASLSFGEPNVNLSGFDYSTAPPKYSTPAGSDGCSIGLTSNGSNLAPVPRHQIVPSQLGVEEHVLHNRTYGNIAYPTPSYFTGSSRQSWLSQTFSDALKPFDIPLAGEYPAFVEEPVIPENHSEMTMGWTSMQVQPAPQAKSAGAPAEEYLPPANSLPMSISGRDGSTKVLSVPSKGKKPTKTSSASSFRRSSRKHRPFIKKHIVSVAAARSSTIDLSNAVVSYVDAVTASPQYKRDRGSCRPKISCPVNGCCEDFVDTAGAQRHVANAAHSNGDLAHLACYHDEQYIKISTRRRHPSEFRVACPKCGKKLSRADATKRHAAMCEGVAHHNS